MRVEERALQILQRSRMCVKCKLLDECTPKMAKACAEAFVDGFKKGWREHAYQSKRRVKIQNECIESGQDGQ